ncbi:hypothetical protein G7047_13440 [Diaphorobacter sp. HDW4A]|uniref:hypothetical protein n=1 Tax=Diaphorobacter sp. HDW4A TaxID=2714924 RepID=UPI00140DF378|nr:hypothetical protein [Diaphorobacter sp. HDW4A]QIL78488.1 hypothetical protein G7047_00045 [Diaphorobacter sp. HDW4A]QIL80796.1 hypothetical protein G7047_13440 [Diaphorobacter sp. HDW4A]
MSAAFVMTWCDADGVQCSQPLAARTWAAAWDAAFSVAEGKGWGACCRFAVGRSGAKGRA